MSYFQAGKGKLCSDSFPSNKAAVITDIDQCKEAAHIIGTPFGKSEYNRGRMPGCFLFLGYRWTVPIGSDMEVGFNTNIDSKYYGSNFDSHLCRRGTKQLKSLSMVHYFCIVYQLCE